MADKSWARTALGALRWSARCATFGTCLLASAAGAGSAPAGIPSFILPLYNGASSLVFFDQSATAVGHPACATMSRWVINVATPGGQAMVSVLLTAYSLGKPISVQGTGACADWGDTESVQYIVMQ